MRIKDRLKRLEEAVGPNLCERRPCKGPITYGQRRLREDGIVEVSGERPAPLCDACPERDNPKAPIRHIEVCHGFPPGGDIWEVGDIEDETNENTAVLRVEYEGSPESESVADAGAAPRRPMVRDPEPDPMLAPASSEATEEAAAPLDDDLPIPPAWGPDHPNHPDFQEPTRRRGRNREGPVFRPEDFGLRAR